MNENSCTATDSPNGGPVLVITRGLPASGKTSLAVRLVDAKPERRLRINRDDLRTELFQAEGRLAHEQEAEVTRVQVLRVKAALAAGRTPICNDTNLDPARNLVWRDLAAAAGAQLVVWDVATPVEECIRRDAQRGAAGGRSVGADVIREFAGRYLPNGWHALPVFALQ